MSVEQINVQLLNSRSSSFYIIGLYLNPDGFLFVNVHHAGLQRYSATVELRNQSKLFWGYQYRELFRSKCVLWNLDVTEWDCSLLWPMRDLRALLWMVRSLTPCYFTVSLKYFLDLECFTDEYLILQSYEEQKGIFNSKTSLPWKTPVFKNILNVNVDS